VVGQRGNRDPGGMHRPHVGDLGQCHRPHPTMEARAGRRSRSDPGVPNLCMTSRTDFGRGLLLRTGHGIDPFSFRSVQTFSFTPTLNAVQHRWPVHRPAIFGPPPIPNMVKAASASLLSMAIWPPTVLSGTLFPVQIPGACPDAWLERTSSWPLCLISWCGGCFLPAAQRRRRPSWAFFHGVPASLTPSESPDKVSRNPASPISMSQVSDPCCFLTANKTGQHSIAGLARGPKFHPLVPPAACCIKPSSLRWWTMVALHEAASRHGRPRCAAAGSWPRFFLVDRPWPGGPGRPPDERGLLLSVSPLQIGVGFLFMTAGLRGAWPFPSASTSSKLGPTCSPGSCKPRINAVAPSHRRPGSRDSDAGPGLALPRAQRRKDNAGVSHGARSE